MANENQTIQNQENPDLQEELSEPNSKFQLVIVAAQRSKQLTKGARARVDVVSTTRKNTRVAIEEVNEGLINFKNVIEQV